MLGLACFLSVSLMFISVLLLQSEPRTVTAGSFHSGMSRVSVHCVCVCVSVCVCLFVSVCLSIWFCWRWWHHRYLRHLLARSSSCVPRSQSELSKWIIFCLLSSDWLLGAGWKLASEVWNTMLSSTLSSIPYEADSREVGLVRNTYCVIISCWCYCRTGMKGTWIQLILPVYNAHAHTVAALKKSSRKS